MRTEPKLAPKY